MARACNGFGLFFHIYNRSEEIDEKDSITNNGDKSSVLLTYAYSL